MPSSGGGSAEEAVVGEPRESRNEEVIQGHWARRSMLGIERTSNGKNGVEKICRR